MQTYKQKVGLIGENIAVKRLKKLGFKILERNYRKKWGEILAQKRFALRSVIANERSEVHNIFPRRGYKKVRFPNSPD